jgi:hypothetical protein
MKHKSIIPLGAAVFMSSMTFALPGYDDIYIDREQELLIHSIYCAKDLNNLSALQPAYVYTNSATIAKGTYYYSSVYGDFSYTFNTIPDAPAQVLMRGLLKQGQTSKEEMQIDVCIVDQLEGLPSKLNNGLVHKTIEANAADYNDWMVKYTALTGKPAYAAGVYQDPRNSQSYLEHDQAVFTANQAYITELESLFTQKFNTISQGLGQKLTDAIATADEMDGFLADKTYPVVQEPSVWTPTSEARYNDQQRRLSQEKQWDIIIQQNFDWWYALAGRGNGVKSSLIIENEAQWQAKDTGMVRVQTATLVAELNDGKVIELDFEINSSKADFHYFEALADISTKADNARRSMDAFNKKPRAIVDANNATLDVYSPTEKRVIFFSLFREVPLGERVRVK